MISLHHIETAAQACAHAVHRTPLLGSRRLGELTDTRLFFKAENLQRTGSFKVRGVCNKIRLLSDDEKARGLIGVSAGNHAQALAYAATAAGVKCVVVMPENAPAVKVAASRAYGAHVVQHGTVWDAFARMEALIAEHGYTLVHPYDDEAVIAGQGTVGTEIAGALDDLDLVLVPVGGGGLISGIATAVKSIAPRARVIGVEPEGAAGMRAALDAGKVVKLASVDTIADGLAAPVAGTLALEHVRAYVDDVVTVSDDAIRAALCEILQATKQLVEPAGAAGYAALKAGAVTAKDQTVAVVLSGGNVDMARLKSLLP